MDKIALHYVRNGLDPLRSTETMEVEAGRPLRLIVAELHPLAPSGFDIIACVNGRVIEEGALDLVPQVGDSVVIAARPLGGGGKKNPWATVAMLAVTLVASAVTMGVSGLAVGAGWQWGFGVFAEAGFWAGAAGIAAGMAVGIAGGLAVNALFPPPAQDTGGPNSAQGNSPTYGWEAGANPVAEGVTLPMLYGTHRVTPPIIGKYVETVGSNQHLNLLMAVAGHQLDSIGSVEINNQPMSSYRATVIETRPGSLNQAPCQHFGDTREDTAIQAKLSMEWTERLIPGNGAQALGIGIVCPALYRVDDKGNIKQQHVRLHIEIKREGDAGWTRLQSHNEISYTVNQHRWSGGYALTDTDRGIYGRWYELEVGSTNYADHIEGERYNPPRGTYGFGRSYQWRWIYGEVVYGPGAVTIDYAEIAAASTSAVRRVYWVEGLPEGQYRVRARFAEQPPTGDKYGTDAYLDHVQSVIYDDFSYPGVALLAVRALATDQLSGGLPRITCLARRNTVRVWNPSAEAYAAMPADNPAWACYDLLHNELAGNVPASRINYPAFKAWADWCAARNYKVNLYFDSVGSLRRSLDMVSTLGRGTVVQVGSMFTCVVDRPWTAPAGKQAFLFGMGNIVADSYREEWVPYQDRATVAEITYFDAEQGYTRQTVEVPQDGLDDTGREVVRRSETLYGCTSRSQAIQHGRALMRRNRYLSLSITFDADFDAIHCLPGDVIDVSHDVPQWGYSGRLVAVNGTSVELDREVTLNPGVNYALQVKRSDDSRVEIPVVGVSVETTTRFLTVSGSWGDSEPVKFDLYAFGQVGRVTKQFRVLSITRSGSMRRRVTALEYMPEVYADNAAMPAPEYTGDLALVRSLLAKEVWALGPDGSGRSILDLSWRGNALSWYVFLRSAESQWESLGQTLLPSFKVERPLLAGQTYEVAVSGTASRADGETTSVTILGKLAPPSDVTNFMAWPLGDEFQLRWDHILDADLWGYEIRHGVDWGSGQVCIDGVQENSTRWRPSHSGTYTFWIKAVDESGNYSESAVSHTTNIALSEELNIVWDEDEIPIGVSAATLEGLIWLPGQNRIGWIPGMSDADFDPDQSNMDIPDYVGDVPVGIYTSQPYDLGDDVDFTLRLSAQVVTIDPEATDLTYPERTDLAYPSDTDQSVTAGSSYRPEYRTSFDGEEWSTWDLWTAPVALHARFVQFRVSTVIESPQVYFAFTGIAPLIDVPDKEATVEGQAISADGTTIYLAELGLKIVLKYVVSVTVLGTSPLTPVVEKHADRFTVRLHNLAGAGVAGSADLRIGGF